MLDNFFMIALIVVGFGMLLAVPVGYIAYEQAKARRQADQIIAGKRHQAVHEINCCISTLEKRGKSLLGFGRWGSEQDRYRVEGLREIRDNGFMGIMASLMCILKMIF